MKKIYTIGRDRSCDIVIPDNTDVISRLHATIRVESNDKIYLIDQSLNGTYVNGIKMSSNVEVPISRKDIVSFAHIYNLDWSQIPKSKNNVLRNVLIGFFAIIAIVGIISVLKIHIFSEKQPDPPVVIKDTIHETVKIKNEVVVTVTDTVRKTFELIEEPEEVTLQTDTIINVPQQEKIYNPIY